jgi:hypothetical protein
MPDHGNLGSEVAVHGLRPDDETPRSDALRACHTDVEHARWLLERDHARSRDGSFNRPDSTHQPRLATQLRLGRCDEEDVWQARLPLEGEPLRSYLPARG